MVIQSHGTLSCRNAGDFTVHQREPYIRWIITVAFNSITTFDLDLGRQHTSNRAKWNWPLTTMYGTVQLSNTLTPSRSGRKPCFRATKRASLAGQLEKPPDSRRSCHSPMPRVSFRTLAVERATSIR